MNLIEILKGLITPLLGVVGAVILVFQYLLYRQRWRLDMYDKRYPVYDSTMQFISFIVQHQAPTPEELTKFLRNCKDKEFLFGKDVQRFLEKLYQEGTRLAVFGTAIREAQGHAQRSKRYEEKQQLVTWFRQQFETSKKLFAKYLSVKEK